MEEVLKLITAEQSKRTELFMFFWKVLIAILLTNAKLNSMGYVFINAEIKINTVIKFILSEAFPYVCFYYLIFIFFFFWLIKILFVVIFLIIQLIISHKGLYLDSYLFTDFFSFWGLMIPIQNDDQTTDFRFKNRDNFDLVQTVSEMLHQRKILTDNFLSYINILFSTSIWSIYIHHDYSVLPSWLPYSLAFLTLLLILLFTFWLFFSEMFSHNFDKYMVEFRLKGFYEG